MLIREKDAFSLLTGATFKNKSVLNYSQKTNQIIL